MNDITTIFFDLFFTLIKPTYLKGRNENDVIGLSVDEWEQYAENDELYQRRATGIVVDEEKIIDEIAEMIPLTISNSQRQEILLLRKQRMKKALMEVNPEILETLRQLHEKGIKTCLISNADSIDVMYWRQSPLFELFDDAVFSYEVHCLKPNVRIYQIGLEQMNVSSQNCLFVGDGGSNELYGARQAGMKTVFSEFLEKKSENKKREVLQNADYCIEKFNKLLELI